MDQLVGYRLSSDVNRKRECHAGRCCLRLHSLPVSLLTAGAKYKRDKR
jgi:hypothetical protein